MFFPGVKCVDGEAGSLQPLWYVDQEGAHACRVVDPSALDACPPCAESAVAVNVICVLDAAHGSRECFLLLGGGGVEFNVDVQGCGVDPSGSLCVYAVEHNPLEDFFDFSGVEVAVPHGVVFGVFTGILDVFHEDVPDLASPPFLFERFGEASSTPGDLESYQASDCA